MLLPCADQALISEETARDLLARALLARNYGHEALQAFWRHPDHGWHLVRFPTSGTVTEAIAAMALEPVPAPEPEQQGETSADLAAQLPGGDAAGGPGARLIARRLALLRARMAHDPALASLHALEDEEWDRLVQAPNRTAQPLPATTLADLFRDRAAAWPHHVAVTEGDTTLDYAALHDRAARVAACLRDAGLRPGDAVGVLADRSTEAVVAILGAVLAGVVYVPLSPDWPGARIRAMAAAADARIVLCARMPAGMPQDVTLLPLRDAQTHPRRHDAPDPRSATSRAYILFTSGSTGAPKGVLVTHRGVARLVLDRKLHPIRPGQSVMHAAPLTFDASTKEIWLPLLNGGRIVILSRDDVLSAARFRDRREAVDFAFLTTALFETLVEQDAGCLSGIAHLYVGGEVVRPEAFDAALAVPGIGCIRHCYGPTETTVYAMAQEMRPGTALSLGYPIANTTAYVLDADLRPVPPEAEGEICIGGDGVALGYLGDAGRSARHFIACPPQLGEGRLYRSGDRGRWLSDGRIVFRGRCDNQIKLRGHRIELEEVEAAITGLPGVLGAVVRVHQPQVGDRRLIAWVRMAAPAGSDWLRGDLAGILPDYMLPAWIIQVAAFPLTPHGKIDHARLPRPDVADPGDLGGTPETVVLAMLREALVAPEFSAAESFIGCGGTSLLAVRLMQRIEARWHIAVPIPLFFQDQTAARLAGYLELALGTRMAPDDAPKVRI